MFELIGVSTNGIRTYSNCKGVEVDVGIVEHQRDAYSVMTRMVARGEIDRFLDRTLSFNVRYEKDSSCISYRFNPGVKPGGYNGHCTDPEWFLDPTEENVQRVLIEVEKLIEEC